MGDGRLHRELSRGAASFKINGYIQRSHISVVVSGMSDLDFAKAYDDALRTVLMEFAKRAVKIKSMVIDMREVEIYPRDVADYLNAASEHYPALAERLAIIAGPSALKGLQIKRIASSAPVKANVTEIRFFEMRDEADSWVNG